MILLAKGIEMPLNAATQKLAFIGRSSSGKSYAAGKFVEQLLENSIQTVILDPVGIWYGLRLTADGRSKGFAIPVFGGEHGDIDLLPGSGALMASLVVEKGISCVLDVSYMRKNERKQFVTDFAETLFHLKKKHRSPIHLVIEEAQTFAPQRTISGEERMLGAMEDIVKIGRNYGIGVSLISQRPQSIHKDCLNQTEALFCFQINGTHERKAIVDWVVDKGLSKTDIEGDLSSLKTGTCFLWSPQWLKVLKKVDILKKKTFDSGKTPETGASTVPSRPLAPVDLKEIEASMQSVIDQKKQNDPAELRKEITLLKSQLIDKAKFVTTTVGEKQAGKELQTKILKLESELKFYKNRTNELQNAISKLQIFANTMRIGMEEIINEIKRQVATKSEPSTTHTFEVKNTSHQKIVHAKISGNSSMPFSPLPLKKYHDVKNDHFENGHLPSGEKKILIACAMYENGVDREQLTVLTGYKKSSRDEYLSRLGKRGYVTRNNGKTTITPEGIAALGTDYQPLPQGEELQQYWLGNLPEGEKKILQALLQHHPNSLGRDELSEITGYKKSSRDEYLSRMYRKEIIEKTNEGIKASDNLF